MPDKIDSVKLTIMEGRFNVVFAHQLNGGRTMNYTECVVSLDSLDDPNFYEKYLAPALAQFKEGLKNAK